ncbi:uncharacterized protein LOC143195686 [Rhynchophorus ferrugineus]|uniref:uncharacterized protein LOC143195686 n=1 Tax=Rhynchophorus ferrugineus TaxID=354439 RepID=UPI003FCCD99C
MKLLFVLVVTIFSCQGFPSKIKYSEEENVYLQPPSTSDDIDNHQGREIERKVNLGDNKGEDSYLLPLGRAKRQTSVQLKSPGIGTLSHKSIILDNRNHQLSGMGFVTKDFTRKGLTPDILGGNLGYVNKPSGSKLGIGADSIRGYGNI